MKYNALYIINKLKEISNVLEDKDLAHVLGVDPSTISQWKRRNSVDEKLILEKFPKLDANELFGRITKRQSETPEAPLQGQIVRDHATMPLEQDPAYWRGKYEAQKEIVDQLLSAKKDKPDPSPAPKSPAADTVKKNQEKGSN